MSLEGGAPIFIRLDGGLDDMPSANLLSLESQNIPNAHFPIRSANGMSR